jgi:hypothetical protein
MSPEVIEIHLKEIKETLDKILGQAEKTNGRVTALEMWKERMTGTYNGGKVMIAIMSSLAGILGAFVGAHLQ